MRCQLGQIDIGDTVRLANGWTPMVVIHIYPNGQVRAKYCHKYPVTAEHFRKPEYATGCQTRYASEFAYWDGPVRGYPQQIPYQPPQPERPPMPVQYRTQNGRVGFFVNTAGPDAVVLNMDIDNRGGDNMMEIHTRALLTEIVPYTFEVKAVGTNYRCHYILPEGNCRVQKTDILVSESGNVYIVTSLDTKCRSPKKIFKGRRAKLVDL